MNTQIAYVLTSDENDSYLEQFFVSLLSLRKYMPNAHVVLLTDKLTKESFKDGWRSNIVGYIDECIVVDIPEGMNKKLRSRYIKTQLRKVIKGDFVYIDCDTIIMGPLDELDELDCKIGAVKDAHCNVANHPMRNIFIVDNHKVGFAIENESAYFNGGFFFVRDCPDAYEFFSIWNREWEMGVRKGVCVDMPSLAKTNGICGHIISEIPAEYNCQLVYGAPYFSKAKVLHYFSSNFGNFSKDYPFYFQSKNAFTKIKESQSVNDDIMQYILEPFSAFVGSTEILAGREVDFVHSPIVSLMRRFYYKYPKLYNKICSFYYFLYKRRR